MQPKKYCHGNPKNNISVLTLITMQYLCYYSYTYSSSLLEESCTTGKTRIGICVPLKYELFATSIALLNFYDQNVA
jgi:hypothetical protein